MRIIIVQACLGWQGKTTSSLLVLCSLHPSDSELPQDTTKWDGHDCLAKAEVLPAFEK